MARGLCWVLERIWGVYGFWGCVSGFLEEGCWCDLGLGNAGWGV